MLITGGAGFIGSNLADRKLAAGDDVTILDDLSRPGARMNLAWLHRRHGKGSFRLIAESVADAAGVRRAAESAELIVHLAGQVAVTGSVADPIRDFRDNALGTLNVLEAARLSPREPIVLYASTNKVYGCLKGLRFVEEATRHSLLDHPFGIDEDQPLDFLSPYGCSKGCGDQYTLDWARTYGLRTVVFRQSCVYGPRQFGVEDQGWIAWFIIAALTDRQITVYGDGKQVRDVLFVEDLLDAYDTAVEKIDQVQGAVFNVGGGPANTISVWAEFGPLLANALGRGVTALCSPPRVGDQKVYVSDVRRVAAALGWQPRTSVSEGVRNLLAWAHDHRRLFGREDPNFPPAPLSAGR